MELSVRFAIQDAKLVNHQKNVADAILHTLYKIHFVASLVVHHATRSSVMDAVTDTFIKTLAALLAQVPAYLVLLVCATLYLALKAAIHATHQQIALYVKKAIISETIFATNAIKDAVHVHGQIIVVNVWLHIYHLEGTAAL